MGFMSEELEVVDQGRIDEVIWRHMGVKSTREIAEMAGVSPAEVLRRTNELIDSVDVLSIQVKRQRLLIELDGMARDARDRAKGTIDEFYSGMLNSSVAAIKTMLQELARMERQDSGKVEALNNLRVRELMRLVDSTVRMTLTEIAQEHDLDEDELMEVFQGHLVEAAREMEAGEE